jgi:tetratricopeptide (TPR) repeat protein
MSRRKIVLIAIAVVVTGSVYLGLSWYRQAQVEECVELARQELRAVFSATTPQQRQGHARACVEISEPLVGEEDPTGATAALFVVSAAPIADVSTDVEVPAAKRVKDISTEDLLLITQALYSTGRVVPADQLLDLLLDRNDEFREESLVLASAIRIDLGRDEEVLGYCDELIALDSAASSPYRMQAMVHRRHGKWDHYVQAVEKARARMQQEDPILQIELIDGYIRIGRFDEAHREFDKLEVSHPELVSLMPTVHARLLIHKGNAEKAGQVLTDYLKSDPSDVEALVIKGKLAVDTQDFEAAISILQTALRYDPSAHDAHFQIGQAYARLNQADLANHHLALHRKLLDSKVRMYQLEQKAAHEPGNVAVRRELAAMYSEIQLPELATFWERAANAAEGK